MNTLFAESNAVTHTNYLFFKSFVTLVSLVVRNAGYGLSTPWKHRRGRALAGVETIR